MGTQFPTGGTAPGSLSPDGRWYWDGSAWQSAVSGDGYWRWTGSAWEPPGATGWPPWAKAFSPVRERGTRAVRSLVALIAAAALFSLGDLVAIALKSRAPGGKLSADDQALAYLAQGLPGLVYLAAVVATIVIFLMWLHRAYRNLPALGAPKPRFSPSGAVWAWFIPILNLWRPYQILREVWQVSNPGRE
jgi:hypothetical protein